MDVILSCPAQFFSLSRHSVTKVPYSTNPLRRSCVQFMVTLACLHVQKAVHGRDQQLRLAGRLHSPLVSHLAYLCITPSHFPLFCDCVPELRGKQFGFQVVVLFRRLVHLLVHRRQACSFHSKLILLPNGLLVHGHWESALGGGGCCCCRGLSSTNPPPPWRWESLCEVSLTVCFLA